MTLRKDRLVIVTICSELLLLEPLLGKSVACHFIVGYHPVLLEVIVPAVSACPFHTNHSLLAICQKYNPLVLEYSIALSLSTTMSAFV